jgi:hypothetical protein
MIGVDNSQLTLADPNFLKWCADALRVTVTALLRRIVSAALHGERYTEKLPDSP